MYFSTTQSYQNYSFEWMEKGGKNYMDIFEMFYKNRNEEQSKSMEKYMKNQFPFLGLKKPERAILSKKFLKTKKKDKEIDWGFIFRCYDMVEREFQYLAIDYMDKVKDLFKPTDMDNIERLLTRKSWWDSVDAINRTVGHIAMKYPEVKEDTITRWMESDNIWLIRISILFQLKYKENTDTGFLTRAILHNSETTEFFINKAIGWVLREYSKTNKEWVKAFIENNELSKLSVREGSKYI